MDVNNFLSAHPIIIGSALILVVVFIAISPSFGSPIAHLPLPPGSSFIWGHEKAVFVQQPGRAYGDWIRKFGRTFRIKAAFGAPDILVLSDPVGVNYLLQKKVFDYHHSEVVRPRVARLLGKGLGWIEGEDEHKRMRRLSRPALTADNIRGMSSDIIDASWKVTEELIHYVEDNKHEGRAINIIDWTGKSTLNIVGRVAFLHDFKAGNSEEAQNILNARKKGVSPATQYIGFLTLMLLRRFHVFNYLPIGAIQGQGLAKRTVHAGVAKELIDRSRGLLDDAKRSGERDLLSRLLLATAEEKVSKAELYEHISTFIIAGFESTTTTVGFSLWELARHPEKQERLRKELVPNATWADLQPDKAPYLDAVLKETLRLYPGLPYMERTAVRDDVIPLQDPVVNGGQLTNNIVVKKGQTVLIPIVAIQRSIPDGDTFQPERWLSENPPDMGFGGYAGMLAFSDGPRSCVGAQLAIFNYKVILTQLLTRFTFEHPRGLELKLKIASSLQPWVFDRSQEDDRGRNELPVIMKPFDG
ncbi:cytochrome P450 [Marasmius fiardii PR-910]|nr:cytochrome P450 [Marasmius fiardii PR-910]